MKTRNLNEAQQLRRNGESASCPGDGGSAKLPMRLVACAMLVLITPAHAINIGVEIKIGGTRIGTSVGIPIGSGEIGVSVSPVPGQTSVTIGNQTLAVNSVLTQMNEKELGKIAGDVVREAGIGYSNLERETKKGLTKVDTNLRKAVGDLDKSVRKAGDDAARELKATQHEVEGAATAAYRFTVRQAEGSMETVRQAERRFREGKVIDAVWHLGLQPAQNTSDNAALAATESSVVATAMSVAASTYGGPGGSAAYAAWLAYYQTGGDVNSALRVGLTAAIHAYGAQYAAVAAAAPDAAAAANARDAAAAGWSESFKHAAVGGAMNGLAVAASGGSIQDVQQTMLATAGSLLVQDGYRSLSQNASQAEFTKAAKQVYCLKSTLERSDDRSCPSLNDYVADAQGRLAMLDTSGVVQYIDKAKEIPGADWVLLSKEQALTKAADMAGIKLDQLPVKEIDAKVKEVAAAANKFKGANMVALLDDRWALSYETRRVVAKVNSAVAPSVLLSYTGISPDGATTLAKDAGKALDAALPKQPQEIVSCAKGDAIERLWVAKGKKVEDLQCIVGQEVNEVVSAAWYAKNEGNFCNVRMLDMAKALMANGYSCSGR